MRKKNRDINIFSLSAIDLFCSGMGGIMVLMVMLMPYYMNNTRTRDVEVAFVIDTTGSMSPDIENLRSSLKETTVALQRMAKSVRIGIVQYKDNGFDQEGVSSFPLTMIPKISAETNNSPELSMVERFVSNLEAGEGGFSGGYKYDGEALLSGISEASSLNWSKNPPSGTKQLIVVITDDFGHTDENSRLKASIATWRSKYEGRSISYVVCRPSSRKGLLAYYSELCSISGSNRPIIGSSGMMALVLDSVSWGSNRKK